MSDYRRYYVKGGTYFFTVVTYHRFPIFKNPNTVNLLNEAFATVKKRHPFTINAIVILPDHLHTIWTLPQDEADYSVRWMLIKNHFTRLFSHHRNVKTVHYRLWQRRFWEHMIRDEEDLARHFDYIHYNPVKHGLVTSPAEWHYSSFGKYVQQGNYDKDWGDDLKTIYDMNLE